VTADRRALSDAFVAAAGWGGADRRFLAGDASDRSYDRLVRDGQSAVLMDAPPGKGDDTATFAAIAGHLASLGLSPPAILHADHERGFLLIEDLGDGLVARIVAADPAREGPLYAVATDVLLHLHRHPAHAGLPDLTARDWADAAAFALDWYAFAATGTAPDSAAFRDALGAAMAAHADAPRVMILRDYHAENLLWLPDRQGVARIGLLDFQLAQMGQREYDLVSLLQDARRDVSVATEGAAIRRFLDATGRDGAGFSAAYATLGAQRALRILGIFARLCLKAGKAGYLPLMPRVWAQLQRNLTHPALADLAAICQPLLPPPDDATLARIARQCGTHPHR
jgi:aminoglycoside/choline kinase family phosphotransferase